MNDKDTELIWEAYVSKEEKINLVWEAYMEAQKNGEVLELVWESVYQTLGNDELAWDKDNRDRRHLKYTSGPYEVVAWQNGDGSYSVEVKSGDDSLIKKDNLDKQQATSIVGQMVSAKNTTELNSALSQRRGYVEPDTQSQQTRGYRTV